MTLVSARHSPPAIPIAPLRSPAIPIAPLHLQGKGRLLEPKSPSRRGCDPGLYAPEPPAIHIAPLQRGQNASAAPRKRQNGSGFTPPSPPAIPIAPLQDRIQRARPWSVRAAAPGNSHCAPTQSEERRLERSRASDKRTPGREAQAVKLEAIFLRLTSWRGASGWERAWRQLSPRSSSSRSSPRRSSS